MGRVGERPLWILVAGIFIRALHQVGAGVFLASFLLDNVALPSCYLYLVMLTGILLVCTEAMRHQQLYRELSGVTVVLKMVLIGLAFHGLLPERLTMIAAFLLAAVIAHAPKVIRHRLLF